MCSGRGQGGAAALQRKKKSFCFGVLIIEIRNSLKAFIIARAHALPGTSRKGGMRGCCRGMLVCMVCVQTRGRCRTERRKGKRGGVARLRCRRRNGSAAALTCQLPRRRGAAWAVKLFDGAGMAPEAGGFGEFWASLSVWRRRPAEICRGQAMQGQVRGRTPIQQEGGHTCDCNVEGEGDVGARMHADCTPSSSRQRDAPRGSCCMILLSEGGQHPALDRHYSVCGWGRRATEGVAGRQQR